MATTISDFTKALHAALDATLGAMADNLYDDRSEEEDFGYAEDRLLHDDFELGQPVDGAIRITVGKHSTTLAVEQDAQDERTFHVLVPLAGDAPANDRGWSKDTMSTADWVNLIDWPFTVLELTKEWSADTYEIALFVGATYDSGDDRITLTLAA